MKNLKYKFVVAGAGVSGLTTAYALQKVYPGDVLVLEKDSSVGGLCKTVNMNNMSYDLGSHRIHWKPREKAFNLIKDICGEALVKKVRGGKLRLKKSYINYPITSVNMFFGLGLIESFLCAASLFKNRIYYNNANSEDLNYESYLVRRAGDRAYRLFYEPYARKVWGCEPSSVSISAVKKRISMVKPTRFLQDMIANYFKKDGNFFYYLEGGIGCFSDGLERHLINGGCKVVKNVSNFSIKIENGKKNIIFPDQNEEVSVEFDRLISTIPVDELVLKLHPEGDILEAVSKIKWRGLRLVYLHIKGEPQLSGETFYFPELKYIFGRVSIPKRFSRKMQPNLDYTSFTCEVPYSEGDSLWDKADKEIYDLCLGGLREAGLITKKQGYLLEKNFIINTPKVYPVYLSGWKDVLGDLLKYLASDFPYIYTSGKMGFFMHCNLDHSIDIGLFLADHITKGKSPEEWYSNIDLFHNMKLRD